MIKKENYSSVNGDPDTSLHSVRSLATENSGNTNVLDQSKPIHLVSENGETIPNIMVYGNHLRNSNPFKMGKMYTFLFSKDEPIIVLGPQCMILSYD